MPLLFKLCAVTRTTAEETVRPQGISGRVHTRDILQRHMESIMPESSYTVLKTVKEGLKPALFQTTSIYRSNSFWLLFVAGFYAQDRLNALCFTIS